MDFFTSFESVLILSAELSMAATSIYALAINWRSPAHRVYAIGMMLLFGETFFGGMSLVWGMPSDRTQWLNWRMAFSALVPGVWLLFALVLGTRDFRSRFKHFKWLIIAAFFLFPLSLYLIKVGPFKDERYFTVNGDLHYSLSGAGYVFHLLFIVFVVALMVVLEDTLRSSRGIKRWQIKFLYMGILGYFAVRIYSSSQVLLFRSLNLGTEVVFSAATLIIVNFLIAMTFVRARVLPEDIYVSGKLITRSIVLLLTGSYLIAVGLLAKILLVLELPVKYQLMNFLIFVALIFLAVILFSDRLRVFLKDNVSKHFQRPRYNYREVWITFTKKTSSAENIGDLAGRTANLISEYLEFPKVNIWLFDERKDAIVLAGSTSISHIPDWEDKFLKGSESLKNLLQAKTKPFDLYNQKRSELMEFGVERDTSIDSMGMRYVVPLRVEGALLGFISLGHRIINKPLGHEDLDLLSIIGLQVAARIHSLEMSRRLQDAKEMEALRRFSTFFVHDLKNVASKLSMMLTNFLNYYNNPDFREDALTLVSQTVDRINNMTQKLTEIKEFGAVNLVLADINRTVQESIVDIPIPERVSITTDFSEIPSFPFDPGQFSKVVTNLVINAMEAVGESGNIRVRTSKKNGWISLEVSDDGPGIEEKFISTSLFQPFKTTKKNGLGIGLYQCRSVVEAHGGRIVVQSLLGEGTTFQIFLPENPSV
jgi:putative PEP-CTERM system histidine kinase